MDPAGRAALSLHVQMDIERFGGYVLQHFQGALWAIRVVAMFLVPMLVAELLRPGRRLHGPTVAFNLLYAPVYLTIAGMLLEPMWAASAPWLPANLLGWSVSHAPPWQAALLVLAYLACFDFFYYWFHRMQHRWPLMWRYHRFHHADSNVSVSSATRHHWLEEALRFFVMSVPLLLLFGSPERTLPWMGILIGVLGLFIHWNAPLRLGPLVHVVVGPQYHRLHHSVEPRHWDRNFAVMFPLWDRLFGTQVLPQGKEFPVTGLDDAPRSNALALLAPLPARRGEPAQRIPPT
jgi:sterol desaturase/sphingolipid hydroxylase (fatty acid hydroxylase superfamily)